MVMLPSTIPRKHVYALLAAITLCLFLFAHYSYSHASSDSGPFDRTSPTSPLVTLSKKPFPHKIWQSWKDDSEDPTDRTVGYPHQWRVVNPDWRYERITDANIDAYVVDQFDNKTSSVFTSVHDPILKADFLRYLILLKEGGVWADIDVLPKQPVSKWIPEKYRDSGVNLVIGIENDHHHQPIWPGSNYSVQLCQYTVLAKPGHPAIELVVDETLKGVSGLLERKPKGPITFEDVMSTTGPFIFTKALMDYFTSVTGEVHNGDELDSLKEPRLIGDVLVLPKDSFGWLSFENTHEEGDPSILVQHLFIGSWREGHPG